MKKAAMGNLPEDVITEILSWLPLKSLTRLSCLSKFWNELIFSNPHFSVLRFNHAPQNPKLNTQKLLITTPSELLSSDVDLNSSSINTLDFPLNRPYCWVQIVGSCNGLVCIAADTLNDIVLWNPSAGLYRKLPEPPHLRYILSPFNYAFGFGYDELSDDYKVVIAVPKPCSFAWIFSLKANAWKRKSLFNSYDDTIRFDEVACSQDTNQRGVLMHGVLYWWGPYIVYGFDLGKENCYQAPILFDEDRNISYTKLGFFFYLSTHYTLSSHTHYNLTHNLVVKQLDVDEDAAYVGMGIYNGEGKFNMDSLPLCIGKFGEVIVLNSNQSGCDLIVYHENLISPYDWMIKR